LDGRVLCQVGASVAGPGLFVGISWVFLGGRLGFWLSLASVDGIPSLFSAARAERSGLSLGVASSSEI